MERYTDDSLICLAASIFGVLCFWALLMCFVKWTIDRDVSQPTVADLIRARLAEHGFEMMVGGMFNACHGWRIHDGEIERYKSFREFLKAHPTFRKRPRNRAAVK